VKYLFYVYDNRAMLEGLCLFISMLTMVTFIQGMSRSFQKILPAEIWGREVWPVIFTLKACHIIKIVYSPKYDI
jgi:hypothetical protein